MSSTTGNTQQAEVAVLRERMESMREKNKKLRDQVAELQTDLELS